VIKNENEKVWRRQISYKQHTGIIDAATRYLTDLCCRTIESRSNIERCTLSSADYYRMKATSHRQRSAIRDRFDYYNRDNELLTIQIYTRLNETKGVRSSSRKALIQLDNSETIFRRQVWWKIVPVGSCNFLMWLWWYPYEVFFSFFFFFPTSIPKALLLLYNTFQHPVT